jgi:hypothetical protein
LAVRGLHQTCGQVGRVRDARYFESGDGKWRFLVDGKRTEVSGSYDEMVGTYWWLCTFLACGSSGFRPDDYVIFEAKSEKGLKLKTFYTSYNSVLALFIDANDLENIFSVTDMAEEAPLSNGRKPDTFPSSFTPRHVFMAKMDAKHRNVKLE